MSPLEGDAFLHSQMKDRSGLDSARSKAKSPTGSASAWAFKVSNDTCALSRATRSLA